MGQSQDRVNEEGGSLLKQHFKEPGKKDTNIVLVVGSHKTKGRVRTKVLGFCCIFFFQVARDSLKIKW